MPCISPDGTPTVTGKKMLNALKSGKGSPEAVAEETGIPMFRVRSGLRDLIQAGMAELTEDGYQITEKGDALL
jgi:DNA-binding IclR family transcriptional regulator